MNRIAFFTFLLCVISVVTRTIPFVLAPILKKYKIFEVVGKQLPAYIMLLLVIYEIRLPALLHPPFAWPALISIALLVSIHIWQRQVLLSILVGTLSYITFSHFA